MSNLHLENSLDCCQRNEEQGVLWKNPLPSPPIIGNNKKIYKYSTNNKNIGSKKETAQVLAKAARWVSIGWEVGKRTSRRNDTPWYRTGFRELAHRSRQHTNIPLETTQTNLSRGREILFHHKQLLHFCISTNLHDRSEQAFLGFHSFSKWRHPVN